jgi:hypothetical protein
MKWMTAMEGLGRIQGVSGHTSTRNTFLLDVQIACQIAMPHLGSSTSASYFQFVISVCKLIIERPLFASVVRRVKYHFLLQTEI